MQLLAWTLQILILAAGIHLFLRFVRTTRGNRLIRGLFVSVMVGVVGLWGLATALGLEELEHLLQGSTGFIVVGFAIVFQSELRRGIAQLGEHSFVGRLMKTATPDTIRQVVQAARAMSARRDGALIAFERESNLHTVVETGTQVDADVQARVLESLFHPGGSLHDGAVVIRKDRVAAAGCFLPLSDDIRIDSSMGTRHRAALGLTEETDAVVLVVSEETGAISLAREGSLKKNIDKAHLEAQLRELLDAGGGDFGRREGGLFLPRWNALKRDIAWLPGSILLAWGILYVAHRDIQETRDFSIEVVDGALARRRTPKDGEILVRLGNEEDRLGRLLTARHKVSITGTRSELQAFGGSLSGVLQVEDPEWAGGPLQLDQVQWAVPVDGVDVRWSSGRPPELVVVSYGTESRTLTLEDVVIDDTELNPRYEVRTDEIAFVPGPTIDLRGPEKGLRSLGETQPLELEPLRLAAEDTEAIQRRLVLASRLRENGFSISPETPVEVSVPIQAVSRPAGSITKEVVLVCLDANRAEELAQWTLPANAHTARFTIETSGLIPANADPGSPALVERFGTINKFVEENLRVYVDVAELPPRGEGRSAPIRWTWRRTWRESLDSLGIDEGTLGGGEELNVVLESERDILLERPPGFDQDSQGTTGENL